MDKLGIPVLTKQEIKNTAVDRVVRLNVVTDRVLKVVCIISVFLRTVDLHVGKRLLYFFFPMG